MTVETLTAAQVLYQNLLDLQAYRATLDVGSAVSLPTSLEDSQLGTEIQDGIIVIVDGDISTAQSNFDDLMTVEELTAAQTAYQKLTELQAYKVDLQTSVIEPVEVPTNIQAWVPDLFLTLKNLVLVTVTALISDAQTAFDNL